MSYENTTTAGSPELNWQEYPLDSTPDHTLQALPISTPADTPLPANGYPFPSGNTMMHPVLTHDAALAPAHHSQHLPPGLGWPHARVNQVYYNWTPHVPPNMLLNTNFSLSAGYDLQLTPMNSDFHLQELTPETAAYLSASTPGVEGDHVPPDNGQVVDLNSAPLLQEYQPDVLVDSEPVSGLPLTDLALENDWFTQAMESNSSSPLELPQNCVNRAPDEVDQAQVLQNLEAPVVPVATPQTNLPRTSSVTRTSRKKPNNSVPYQRRVLRLPQVQTGTGSGNSTPSPITSGSSVVSQRYRHVPSPGSESPDESDTRILFPGNWTVVVEQNMNTKFLSQPTSLPHLGISSVKLPQSYGDHICTYVNPHSGEGCWTKVIQGHPSEWLRQRTNGKRGFKGFFGRHKAEVLRHMAWHRFQELKPLMVLAPGFVPRGGHPATLLLSSTPQSALTKWCHAEIDHQLREDLARPNEQTWCKGERRLSKDELKERLSVSPLSSH